MELFHLKLRRFVVANYRSVKRIELDHLENMVWLAGRNNAGKSNLLDAFQFLSDAATSFEHALAARGPRPGPGDCTGRNRTPKWNFCLNFVLAADKRAELIQQLFAENTPPAAAAALAGDFLATLTLKVVIGRDSFAEELTTPNVRGSRPCLIFSIKAR